ncbi:T-complex protein 1 subunit eta [Pancytospora philotis]|nr:T-complex protein 1 subunit eta [Pancytospora philotis]
MNQMLFQTEKIEDSRSGVAQVVSNIEICNSVSDLLATTLGPYGLDKLFYGKKFIVTNDGATILENMEFKHPVARMLAALSKSQDSDVGDGTTSVVILSAAVLNALLPCIREKMPLDEIVAALRELRGLCLAHIRSLAVEFSEANLLRLAETCLSSKSVRNSRAHFARLLVDGLSGAGELHISKVPGGSLLDSELVGGVAFEKTFTYAGYDQQPKKIHSPKVCLLNVELEWKSERENAELRIESIGEYQRVVDAEWAIIKEKLDDVIGKGANVVLSSQPIGDYATQYFAARGVFSAGRVRNLDEIARSLGGRISSYTKYADLCGCDLFEERQLGKYRYNYFEGTGIRARTLLLRGPGADVLEEVERAVHDAVCVIQTALRGRCLVTGGGSVEMQLSRACRDASRRLQGGKMLVFRAVAKAFERVPDQLARNFGLDAVAVMQRLRCAHADEPHSGISTGGVCNMVEAGVYEPFEVKESLVKSCFNIAEAVLMINSTIMVKK